MRPEINGLSGGGDFSKVKWGKKVVGGGFDNRPTKKRNCLRKSNNRRSPT